MLEGGGRLPCTLDGGGGILEAGSMLLYRLPTICRGLTLYMAVTFNCEASKEPGIEH